MARAAGRRTKTKRAAGQLQDGPQSPSASPLAIVVGTPGDALPLLAVEPPGSEITVICLTAGAPEEYRELDRALAYMRNRGCLTTEPFVLDADGREASEAGELLLDALHEIGPVRVATLDPDPEHTSVDKERRALVVTEPPMRARAAVAALRAARAYQEQAGVPVFVECRRAGSDPRLGPDACARYPRTAGWLTTGKDSRLSAHLLSAAGVLRWTEGVPGGTEWGGPELLETPRLMPGLAVLQGDDGFVRLFGLRRTERRDGGELDVVTAIQYQSGRPLGLWHSLGNPNAGNWDKAREVGFPVAVMDGKGTLHVLVRNVGHSISTRRQDAAGRWTPWQHLSGLRIADEMVAFRGWDGGVDVVARARDGGAVHWHFDLTAGAWAENRGIPVDAAPGSLAAAPEAGAVRFRYAPTNEVCVWQPGAPAPIGLGGGDGAGTVTALAGADIQGWGCTVLVRSGRGGVPSVGAHQDGRPDAGVWWAEAGERSLVPPALAFDGHGRVVIATLGPDGTLRVTRQQRAAAGLEFERWQTV